ncbi:hypothetical protein MCAP1_003082 [Malassezia caprae]|uniref:FLZ-type domain-containing protein n=1 Tax=Malassezia caprae TaxID=1381934 RepID=A0AAF0IXX2_9BASI|nr:hypothetical protein MCAP1_003082 [Malassezia caprae]
MAGAKNERRPPPAAKPGRARAVAMPEVCVASDDEEEAAALDADGQGVWDHAFCVVCDCLIETDAQPREEYDLGEEEWEIAAMSSLRRRERSFPARPRPPRDQRAPLFCSERCRQLDLQRSSHMGEFMNYVSRHPPNELRAQSLADRYSPPDSPPRTHAPVSTAAKSLSTSLLRAERRISAAALADTEATAEAASAAPPRRPGALDTSPDLRPSADLFRRRVSWQRPPPARASQGAMPSNLTRARAALDERASPEPSVSSSSTATDMLAGSPPRSVLLGSGTSLDACAPHSASPRAAAPPTARVAALSVSAAAASPLSLLVDGTGHHAEPSVSAQTSRGGTAAAAPAGAPRPSAAAELLRHAQRPRASPDSDASRDTRRGSAASSSTGASSTAARRRRALLDPTPSRGSDGDHTSETGGREVRRARDVRVLPPLLGLPTLPPELDSPHSLTQRGSASDLASMGRPRSSTLSTSLQSSSPRRAGLGWSALSRTPRAEQASAPEVPGRTWSYERLPGMRMYPLMQLPSASVHDTYSHYWPTAGASPPTGRSDATRRKSLFYFDG